METMRLLNLTKLVVLSTALSDTCLLATKNWHIEVGFKNAIQKDTANDVSQKDIANGKEIVTLYIHFMCIDSEKNCLPPFTGKGFYVNPIDNESREAVDWTNFSEEAFAKHFEDFAKTRSSKCCYEVWPDPSPFSNWPDSFAIAGKNGELIFKCGDFQILLDKYAHIQISGGSQGERLTIQKFNGNNAVADEVQLRPIVIAKEKKIKCHLFFVERIDTFINKGSVEADAVILRCVKNVENYGTFRSRNFILAGSSILKNNGAIYWSDFYNLSKNAQVEGKTPIIEEEEKKTGLSFRTTPKVLEYFEDGYGIYLDFRKIFENWVLSFDDLKARRITLYLAGDCRYCSDKAPLMCFTRHIGSREDARKIIDMNEYKVRSKSAVSYIAYYDKEEKEEEEEEEEEKKKKERFCV